MIPKGDFTDIPDKPSLLCCVPCSNQFGRLQSVVRKHMSDHIQTEKHVAALSWQSQQNTANMAPAISATVGAAAALESLTDILPHRPRPSVAHICSESPTSDLFTMETDEDGLYQDASGQSIHFTASEDIHQSQHQALNQWIEDLGCHSHEWLGEFWNSDTIAGSMSDNEDATLSNVAMALETTGRQFMDLDDEEDEETLAEQCEARHDGQKWAPYQSKMMFKLDLLDSLPRLRLSDDHLKTIMWVMKECGTPDVPLFSALRKLQTKLTTEMGTIWHVSMFGNKFYTNGVAQMFHLDWANPFVRPQICPYVEVSSTVSEFYQAKRLMCTDVNLLQLMWADFKNAPGGQHFYIKELARLRDDSAETECADVYLVDHEITVSSIMICQVATQRKAEQTGVAHLRTDKLVRILAKDLMSNILDLKNQGLKIQFDRAYFDQDMTTV
ncbi:hypothetical protein BC835DRAFT_1308149 [Cytidiella melzeri]|nr:hypothetical protein BC835DRAFT_1308149 [Cytidiella melzeri]